VTPRRLHVVILALLSACPGQKPDTGPDTGDSEEETPTDADLDGYALDEGDCDDDDPGAHPGAVEVCDGADNDCDAQTDEGVLDTWYADVDGDGSGDGGSPVSACTQPDDTVSDATDCDDADPGVFPGSVEVCNGIDDDCDGATDDEDGSLDLGSASTCYVDVDEDGYGDPGESYQACVLPDGCSLNALDCDDSDASVHMDASEICDGIDDDCDGLVDVDDDSLADAVTVYADGDGDGYGHGDGAPSCSPGEEGTSTTDGDCDDTDGELHPDAAEICDEIDDDCDGAIDDDDPDLDLSTAAAWFPDGDGDGYGDPGLGATRCLQPAGWVEDSADCDDGDEAIHPDATEICDDVDDDCDALVDEDDDDLVGDSTIYADLDGDGYGHGEGVTACAIREGYSVVDTDCDDGDDAVWPGAAEICDDDVDNDCDEAIDEECGPSCADLSLVTWYDIYTRSTVPVYGAAALLGLSATGSATASTFATLYDAGTWDVLVVDAPGDALPSEVTDRLSEAIDSGTVVLYSNWHLTYDDEIQDLLHVNVDSSFTLPKPLSAGTDDSLWTIWQTLPSSISTYTHDSGINGAILSPTDLATSTTLAFYDVGTTKEAILATYGGQVVVNGFSIWDYVSTDDDSDGVYDMVELYANELVWTTGCTP